MCDYLTTVPSCLSALCHGHEKIAEFNPQGLAYPNPERLILRLNLILTLFTMKHDKECNLSRHLLKLGGIAKDERRTMQRSAIVGIHDIGERLQLSLIFFTRAMSDGVVESFLNNIREQYCTFLQAVLRLSQDFVAHFETTVPVFLVENDINNMNTLRLLVKFKNGKTNTLRHTRRHTCNLSFYFTDREHNYSYR